VPFRCNHRIVFERSRSLDFRACSLGVLPPGVSQSRTRWTFTEWFTIGVWAAISKCAGRTARRAAFIEDLKCQGRRFKHGLGGYLDAVSDPGAIIEGDRARPNAHAKKRTMFCFLFAQRPSALRPPARRLSSPPDLGVLLLQVLERLHPTDRASGCSPSERSQCDPASPPSRRLLK
jgi:hypothetical protein